MEKAAEIRKKAGVLGAVFMGMEAQADKVFGETQALVRLHSNAKMIVIPFPSREYVLTLLTKREARLGVHCSKGQKSRRTTAVLTTRRQEESPPCLPLPFLGIQSNMSQRNRSPKTTLETLRFLSFVHFIRCVLWNSNLFYRNPQRSRLHLQELFPDSMHADSVIPFCQRC